MCHRERDPAPSAERSIEWRGRRRAYALALACQAFLAAIYPALTATAAVAEYEVKAALLFNFALFTKPVAKSADAGAGSQYRICVHGRNPFGSAIDLLAGRAIDQMSVVVNTGVGGEELRQCHLVYFGASDGESHRRAVQSVQGLPIVTVSDASDFPKNGTIFNFVLAREKVAFQVNLLAARAQQLDVSARVVRLAKDVQLQ